MVKYLAERGLSLRGHTSVFGDVRNGNYLGSLELLSQFDPFLRAHMERFGNAGRGNPSYLSLNVCEEFIELMGDKVLAEVVSRVKLAKYFSITVDSTPDVTHIDQLTFILRYVSPEGEIKERFLTFLPITSHTGEALFNSVLKVLGEMDIDIQNCRGQCYDNASNMSGTYKGLQSRIKELNPLAEWIPCAAHTLNLVGNSTANCCEETDNFLNLVQALLNFFSKSPSRWRIVTAGLQKNENGRMETLKALSDTRWSAHADATKPLTLNYGAIQNSLRAISDDEHQTISARNEAKSLSKHLDKLENAVLCNLWNDILQRFNRVSVALQAVNLDLCNAASLVRSLRQYVAGLRDQFDRFEIAGSKMSPTASDGYKADKQRVKIRKRHADDSSEPDVHLPGRRRFAVSVYNVIIDRLVAELDRRYESYNTTLQSFSFLNNLLTTSPEELRTSASRLQRKYDVDLEDDFVEELIQFREFVVGLGIQEDTDASPSAGDLLQLLRKKSMHSVFPNTDIALRLFLTLPVTNASGERSFSKLSLIKNRLRSTMHQDRLSHLTIMSIEYDILRALDFNVTIKEFALRKARRKPF